MTLDTLTLVKVQEEGIYNVLSDKSKGVAYLPDMNILSKIIIIIILIWRGKCF